MESGHCGTVVIVDDDPAVGQALSLFLRAHDIEVIAFSSGEDLLSAPMPPGPACILLDLQMPGLDGLEVQRRLSTTGAHPPLIFFTAHADVPSAVVALKSGATDFIQKSTFNPRELLQKITSAMEQHRRRQAREHHEARVRSSLERLSPRELEVIRLAASGHANKVIGLELGISERTVEVHRGRAMRKLGLRSIAELVRLEHIIAS